MPASTLEPHPLVAFCSHGEYAHAFRVWCLLRGIDQAGTGHLPWAEAVSGLRMLGVSRPTAYRWLRDVCAGPFARRSVSQHGEVVIVLMGRTRLLSVLGLPQNEDHERHADAWVTLDLGRLVRTRYKREFYRAAAAVHNGEPIARVTKKQLYGRSANTQRRAEREVGAVVRDNYRTSDVHPHLLRPQAKHKRNVFPWGKGHNEQIPSSVTIPREVVRRPSHSLMMGISPWGGNRGQHRRRYHAPDRLAASRRPPRPWCTTARADGLAGGGDALVPMGEAVVRGRGATLWGRAR